MHEDDKYALKLTITSILGVFVFTFFVTIFGLAGRYESVLYLKGKGYRNIEPVLNQPHLRYVEVVAKADKPDGTKVLVTMIAPFDQAKSVAITKEAPQ